MYDPKTKKFTLIDTCFSTHHLIFAEDANNTLWLCSGGAASGVIGWLNTKMFEETGDEQKSQGWTAFILDTNGNGKRDEYVEPDQPVDPTKDKRIVAGYYGIGFNPMDGSIWGSVLSFPGAVVRVSPGDNPPATALDGNLSRCRGMSRKRCQWLRPARHGHRSQRRRLDVAGERPSRELRPAQMQRPAQRSERDRKTLSRRLDALSHFPDRSSKA